MVLCENRIFEMTAELFEAMFGLNIQKLAEIPSRNGNTLLTSHVNISGNWIGSISVESPFPFAQRITSLLFDMNPDETSADEIHDAMGEISNVLAGNIKELLPDSCQLSIPVVTEGSNYKIIIPGCELKNRIDLECEGDHVAIKIYSKI